ncbi:MAG: hypothetical protein J2P37_06720 [Ktedonobacteraceae bacterium]|nr:hypothetical protein [Ktedonobacteraceae bacterium]
MNLQDLERLYGGAARYSDYQRGERIAFVGEGRLYTGTILWICAPGCVLRQSMPLRYIVAVDQMAQAPCLVWPRTILEQRTP